MKNICKILVAFGCILMSSSCANNKKEIKPVLVPAVEVKQPTKHELNIVGGVEPIYFPPMKTPFSARMDTGAETSSLDVGKITFFERDGEKWAAFNLINKESGEQHRFEKRIERKITIRRIHGNEQRIAVTMDVKFDNQKFNTKFTLADRTKFDYQALVGRNIITGRVIIDPSIANTLH